MYYDYNYDNKQRFPITATFNRGRNTKASKQLFQEWYESVEVNRFLCFKCIFRDEQLITRRRVWRGLLD